MHMISKMVLSIFLVMFSLYSAADNGPLITAVQNGDTETVRLLLGEGVDINQPSPEGTSVLAYAAYLNDPEMMELLLIRGEAEVNIVNDYGATPLYVAAGNADAKINQLLLRAGADPNVTLHSGESPLMVAANRNRLDTARLLIEHGADPNPREIRGGQTALMWAVSEGHPEMVELLIDNRADVNAPSNSGFTSLMFAAQKGDAETAEILLKAGALANAVMFRSGLTALMIASIGGFDKVARVLMDHGADVDAIDKNGKAVLHHAVGYYPSAAIVRDLLARGANPNIRIKSPKKYVGYAIDPDGSTPLLAAAAASNLEAVSALLDAGADPNIPTTTNTTPLAMAAGAAVTADQAISRGEIERMAEIVKLLLALDVEVNTVGQYGFTALHVAAYHGWDNTIEALIAHGADTEIKDGFGQTPLSISQAIVTVGMGEDYRHTPRSFRKETAELLLSLGATPLEESGVEIATKRAIIE